MSHWSIKLPIRGPNAPLADLIADAFSFKAEERDVVHELVSQAILSSCEMTGDLLDASTALRSPSAEPSSTTRARRRASSPRPRSMTKRPSSIDRRWPAGGQAAATPPARCCRDARLRAARRCL
jgi:hypothetical protein